MAIESWVPERTRSAALAFFPTGFFFLTIGLMSVGLGLSAFDNYSSRLVLSQEFLTHSGREVVAAIESEVKNSNPRDPKVWERVFSKNVESQKGSVSSFSLSDGRGRQIAHAGEVIDPSQAWVPGEAIPDALPVFLYEHTFDSSSRVPEGWEITLGVNAEGAALMVRQGQVSLAVSVLTILTLVGLSLYTLWLLIRFVKLKTLENSERRLTTLGRMAATLAHEIRNPLGAIKGLTQVAQETLPQKHQAHSLMTSVVSETERLENLVTDLLTFAKPRKPEFSSFDLNRLIVDLRRMLQPQLFSKELSLNLNLSGDEFWVYSDENGLRQVLLNVILNSVEASLPGGTIRVSLRQTQDSNIIYVEDTGEGFGQVDPEDLFEPYTTSKVTGSGLGLPISRRIMISLRGTIELSKRKGRGSRCTISFPRASVGS